MKKYVILVAIGLVVWGGLAAAGKVMELKSNASIAARAALR